jgi:hypothetical protein
VLALMLIILCSGTLVAVDKNILVAQMGFLLSPFEVR